MVLVGGLTMLTLPVAQFPNITPPEIQILARAQKKRDYYYRSTKGRRLFQLALGPAALAFVGLSSEADQRVLDRIVDTRPPAEFARALLEYRNVAEAIVSPTKSK